MAMNEHIAQFHPHSAQATHRFCMYCKGLVPRLGFMDHMADKHPPKRKPDQPLDQDDKHPPKRNPDPPLYHDDKTLFKVAEALLKAGCTNTQATDAINEMLNAGILFRESFPEPEVGEDARPHSRACGVEAHPHGSKCHSNCPTCAGVPQWSG